MMSDRPDSPTIEPLPSLPSAAPSFAPVTPRAVLLGLLGAAIIPGFQVVSKAQPQTVALHFGSVLTLFTGVIFFLFLLALGNAALRRIRPVAVLRPAEWAVIYGLATVGAAIGAQDEAQFLFPMYVYPFRASLEDRAGWYRPYVPDWMIPKDPAVVEPYYRGRENFWRPEILSAWLVPLGAWLIWLAALGLTMWAWNVILRRRWVEQDKLSFPCVQLPLEMCRAGGFGGLAAGRLFWYGFAVSALIESINQIGLRFPTIPTFRLDYDLTPTLNGMDAPWKALAPMRIIWSTVHVGIAYLIPTDILFSAGFFYVVRKTLEVWGYAMGWRELGWDARGFPYTRAQSAGAWAALFFLLIWAERRHLWRVLTDAFSFSRRRPGAPDPLNDPTEFGSYRTAGRLLVFGTVFLMWWSVQSGMSWKLAAAYYGFFWILYVTMTRVYAQVGPPILELYFLDPQKALTTVFGSLGESPGSLFQFSLMYWINRDHRGQPMAHQLAAFYVAGKNHVAPRTFGRWVPVAFLVGAVSCLLTYLHWAYRIGEDQWVSGAWREAGANTAVSRVKEWVETPKGPQWLEIGFMGFGALFTLLLAKINYTVIGTPFHPIGYALAVCFAVEYNWPVFLGMAFLKMLLLRYGGLALYVRFIPAFLGLTLGGLVVPVLWSFLGYLLEWYK
jgi:hypothetical protein